LTTTKEPKLIIAYIAEGDEDVFPLSVESIASVADVILVIDGNADGDVKTRYQRPTGFDKQFVTITSPYNHSYKGANGAQRNKYLEYLKQHHVGDFCLVLDCDEFVDRPEDIKKLMAELEAGHFDSCSPDMRHLVSGLKYEDATQQRHTCPLRLFKVNPNLSYPEVEHPVLQGIVKYGQGSIFNNDIKFTIWHLAYAREVFRTNAKWKNHKAKSNIHNEAFLTWWYHAHLFNSYPVREVPYDQLPSILKRHLEINDDYMYFKDRGPEAKHWEDAWSWKNHFNPQTALEVGCGLGHRVRAMRAVGIDAYGFDISQWAIDNCPYQEVKDKVHVYDLTVHDENPPKFDLVVAYDVLEHISLDSLDAAINNLKGWSNKHILVSIPFLGDPNLMNDHTHKIFWTRDQWIERFAKHGLAVAQTPSTFLYSHQLLVLEVQK